MGVPSLYCRSEVAAIKKLSEGCQDPVAVNMKNLVAVSGKENN